jgi:hypothetical protein
MQPSEYLAFIPLLIYGLALADLLGQWRRFFERDYFYLPYFLTTLQYWLYLSQPMLFLITVAALTPEPENKKTEVYFKQRIPIVFGLMALYIGSHLFTSIGSTPALSLVRLITVLLLVVIAVSRRVWLVYVATILWVISLFARV